MSSERREERPDTPYYAEYPPPNNETSIVLCLDSNVFVRHAFSIELWESIEAIGDLFAQCRVIVPEVVLRECERLFNENTVTLKGTRPTELKRELNDIETHLCDLFEKHFAKWRKKFDKVAHIEPTSDALLRSAYDRLMAKKPPCHSRDETRDAIIWETVLAARCLPHKTQAKIFVTQNTKDFPFKSHSGLQAEAKDAGILWFEKFSDLQRWLSPLRPTPWREGIEFATWYEEQDFAWHTTGRLQDELPDYLVSLCEHYDYDAEVFDLDRVEWELISEPSDSQGTTSAVIREEWTLTVSYSVGADLRLGGKDGIEVPVSGWRQASGRATVTRTLTFDASRRLTTNELEVDEIDLEQDEEDWDPHEAWLDSLAEDRDDA